jgi:ribose transport system ATP-binding protein
MAPPRLDMRGIAKSFGGVPVLSGVDLTVEAGDVVALLGANGAGKSTLVKILTGLYARDGGTIRIDGTAISFARPSEAAAAGVRLLPQEISVLPDMTVAENICLGDLPMRRRFGLRVLDTARARQCAASLLEPLGFGAIDPATPVRRLSVAEQRIVEVARALAGEARILIMDEPTAALTGQEAQLIFRIIRRLREQSVAVIYISHYLNEVFDISNRIAVLRDGRNAGTFDTAGATHAAVLSAMLGNTVTDLYGTGQPAAAGAAMLQVSQLDVPGKLENIGFAVGAGEILGVFGLIGSGVEVLGRAIYGVLGPRVAGRIRLGDAPYHPSTVGAAKAAGIGFVAADRKREGIIGELTVRENLALPFQDRFEHGVVVSRAEETAYAVRWIRDFGIRTRGPEQKIRALSGGNQQKVCLARWLAEGIRLLILEEPTRGVDVGARKEIYAALRRLAARGFAVLVLSSDVEEIAGLSDRSLVLDRGRIVGRLPGGASPADLMAATTSDPAFSLH